MKATKTKYKEIQEANVDEHRKEIEDFLKTQFTATAKSREILEDYFEGKPNTGERE